MSMNVIVCGDFEHFGLKISKPMEALVSSIIDRVATTLDVPSEEISLYFKNQRLQPASPFVSQCGSQLGHGAALLVVANPLIITIQRDDYNGGSFHEVKMSRLAAPRWKTETLFDFCLWKAGMPHRTDGKYVFAVQGNVLQEGKKISDYEFLNNNFAISITFLQTTFVQDPITSGQNGKDTRSVLIPTGSSDVDIYSDEQKKFNFNPIRHGWSINSITKKLQFGEPAVSDEKKRIYRPWKLCVNVIADTKYPGTVIKDPKYKVDVENHFLTPVYELRRKVSQHGNVRLVVADTLTDLEDWDEEGRIMLLCSYPQLHDGATLYQINIPVPDPTGTCINVHVNYQYQNDVTPNYINGMPPHIPTYFDEHVTIERPNSIQIEHPNKFTVQRFINAMENFGRIENVHTNDGQQSMTRNELLNLPKPDVTVLSSVQCFNENCTVQLCPYQT